MLGMSIKLLADSKREGERFSAMVCPTMVGKGSPLYSVNGVFNAVFVHGNVLGDAMFYGSGAGKLPTASAVAGDIVDCAKHLGKTVMMNWSSKELERVDIKEVKHAFFVRIKGKMEERLNQVKAVFSNPQTVSVPGLEEEFGFVTECISEEDFAKRQKDWKES